MGHLELQTRTIMTLSVKKIESMILFLYNFPWAENSDFKKSGSQSQCKVHGPSGNLQVGPAGETLLHIFRTRTTEVYPKARSFLVYAPGGKLLEWRGTIFESVIQIL